MPELTSFGQSIITVIFYLIMAAFVIYSILAIYALLSYGRSKILGLVITALYLIISISLYATAVGNLNKL